MSSSLFICSELNSDSSQRIQLLSCMFHHPSWLLSLSDMSIALFFRLLQPSWSIMKPFHQIFVVFDWVFYWLLQWMQSLHLMRSSTRSSAVTKHRKEFVHIKPLEGMCFDTHLSLESFQGCQIHLHLLSHSFFILSWDLITASGTILGKLLIMRMV